VSPTCATVADALPAPVVVGEPGVLCADQAIEHHRRVPGVGAGEVVAHDAHHGRLRGFETAPAARHAIRNRGNAATRLVEGGRAHRAHEVLVDLARALVAEMADVYVKAHAASIAQGLCRPAALGTSFANPFPAAVLDRRKP
jgi:hypothetical protein